MNINWLSVDRSKIDLQVKYWTKDLGVSNETLLDAIDKVGNAAATVRNEIKGRAMPNKTSP